MQTDSQTGMKTAEDRYEGKKEGNEHFPETLSKKVVTMELRLTCAALPIVLPVREGGNLASCL